MPKVIPLVLAATALVVVGAAAAGSAKSIYTYKAKMVAASAIPKPKAPASARGLFTGTVTEGGTSRTLTWKLTFSRLSGKAVAAHIHRGKTGIAGAVVLPLCGPCTSGQTGRVTISKDVADTLEGGRAYVNVHTTKNPAGEIRGQVTLIDHTGSSAPSAPVTDPTTTPTPGYGGGASDPGAGY
jgi:hypothetical protein